MKALRLGRVRCALVVAPHADDEAIGAFGLIARLRRAGAQVRVVVVTDGAASHPNSARWPRARLVAERARETRRAMRAIGVAAGAVEVLGLPDGGVFGLDARSRRRIGRAVRRVGHLDLLVAPAGRDAHPDHRAVCDAVGAAIAPGVRRLAYLVWPDRRHSGRGPMRGIRLGEARHRKRAAILRYRTQTGAITDDPAGFAIAPNELVAFTRPIERFEDVRWRR